MKLYIDDSGRKMSAEEQDGNGLTRFREAYSFDEAAHLSARVRALPTGEFIYGDFSWYDHRGKKAGAITVPDIRELAGNAAIAEKPHYFYDMQGREARQIKSGSTGKKWMEVVKTYDDAGHLHDETSYLSGGRIKDRKLYDHRGAELQELSFDEGGEL